MNLAILKSRMVVFQIVVTIITLVFFFIWVDRERVSQNFININYPYLLFLGILVFFDRLLMVYKWNILLQLKNINIPFGKLFTTYYWTSFLSTILPIPGSGDVLRGLKFISEKDKLEPIVSSIIVERILGFVATVIVGIIAVFVLLISFQTVVNEESVYFFIITLISICLLLFLLLIIFKFPKLLNVIRLPFSNKLFYWLSSFSKYSHYPKELFYFLFLSVMEQISPIVGNYILSEALGLGIPFWFYCLIVPLVQLVSRVPISLNGWGIAEGGYAYFFLMFGFSAADGITLGIFGRLAVAIVSAPSLLFVFSYKRKSKSEN